MRQFDLIVVFIIMFLFVVVAMFLGSGLFHHLLSNYFLKKEKYEKALKILNEGIKYYPHIAVLYLNRAVCYDRLKDYDKMGEDLNKAVELAPKYAPFYYSRAIYYFDIKDFEKAVTDCKHALHLQPDNVDAMSLLGQSKYELNKYKEAIDYFSKALQINPKHSKSLIMRGDCYAIFCRYEEAEADFVECLREYPDDFTLGLRMTMLLIEKNELDQALTNCNKYLEMGIKLPWINYLKSLILIGKRKFEAAMEEINKAIELSEEPSIFYSTRGKIYRIMGDKKKAAENFQLYLDSKEISPYIKPLMYIDLYILNPGSCDEKLEVLKDAYKNLENDEWYCYIIELLIQKISLEECLEKGKDKNEKKYSKYKIDVYFFYGQDLLLRSNREKAIGCFEKCIELGKKYQNDYILAEAELGRLK